MGIHLGPLSAEAVGEYVGARLTGAELPLAAAAVLCERTGGNPLFLENVVDGWISSGLVEQRNGDWALFASPDELARIVPDSLRKLVAQDLSRLDDDERKLLEAASVAGPVFSAEEVAAALGESVEEIEARAVRLADRGRLLDRDRSAERQGGVAERFRFRHELYQEVVYDQLPAGLRAALHRRIGMGLERDHANRAAESAAALAVHFVRGQDPDRAVRYLELAARESLDRGAYEDAVGHLDAALGVLAPLPASRERSRDELELRSALGQALVVTKGWSAPEAEQALLRARALATELGDNEPIVTVLLALATVYEVRGDVARARELAEERVRLVPDAPARHELESNELLACSLLHQGSFTRALEQAELGVRLSATEAGHYETFPGTLGDNAAVSCHSWAAMALWYLGHSDQALQRAQDAIRWRRIRAAATALRPHRRSGPCSISAVSSRKRH